MERPYKILTDVDIHTSNYTFCPVLLQAEKPEGHHIKFVSRLLNSVERKYSTMEKETLIINR